MSGERHTLHHSCRPAAARSNCSACLHKKVSTNNLNKGKAVLGLGIAAAGRKMAHTEFFSNVTGVSSHRKKSSSEFVEGQRHDTVTEPKRLELKSEQFHGVKKKCSCLFYSVAVVNVNVDVEHTSVVSAVH